MLGCHSLLLVQWRRPFLLLVNIRIGTTMRMKRYYFGDVEGRGRVTSEGVSQQRRIS